ncbi:MAG TPA: GHMP kinase [Candidatus Brocadiia bacterium]|nr:GHMP kinase [Candidatus Brocadiia bacterium]
MIITENAYARAGLIGNPSDGYFGKTISIICKNFRAEITLWHTPELEILPSQQDHSRFESLEALVQDVRLNGYYGGVRLVKAAVKRFADYCAENDIRIEKRNFTIRYSSTIPRQVGLAGSSAIITATMRALIRFYGARIPKEILPSIILSAEMDELRITAGLQDRVIQVYEGCVYMDFDKELLEKQGYGSYQPIDPQLLPQLFIACRTDMGGPSGAIHDDVRRRWKEGDPKVIETMKQIADLASQARECLLENRPNDIAPLMDRGFDLRRSIYNIAPKNVEMVMIARRLGASCAFTGSGGAVIGCYKDEEMFKQLEDVYSKNGYMVFKPRIM